MRGPVTRTLAILLLVIASGVLVIGWFRRTDEHEAITAPSAEATRVEANPVELATTPTAGEQREIALPVASTAPGSPSASLPDSGFLVVRAISNVDRAPLSGVRVVLFRDDPSQESHMGGRSVDGTKGSATTSPITGSEGRVEFELPPGNGYRLWARGEDGGSGSSDNISVSALRAGERREIVVELPTGDDLRYCGRLLAREGRTPIAGAKISVADFDRSSSRNGGRDSTSRPSSTSYLSVMTDPDGRFELRLPTWKSVKVSVEATGFSPMFLGIGAEHETPDRAQEILLTRSAALHARLVNRSGGPLSDGSIRLRTEGYHLTQSVGGGLLGHTSSSDGEWWAEANNAGECIFDGLPSTVPFDVELLLAGKVVRRDLPSIALEPGEVREIQWTIGAGCLVEGRIADQSGEAVKGATIWMERANYPAPGFFERFHSGEVIVEATADSDGRFQFKDVSAGTWWIGPAATDSDRSRADPTAIAPYKIVVEIADSAQRQTVDLRVHRGLYIRGKVLKSTGAPAPRHYLHASMKDAAAWLGAQTRDDGTFALGPLVPGQYQLVANSGFTGDAGSEPIDAEAGQSDVVLQLTIGGSISGTVIAGVTGKACRAEVTYTLRGDFRGSVSKRYADTDGSFTLPGLAPGTYDLGLCDAEAGTAILRGVQVQAGLDTGVQVLKLTPGARVHIRYAGTEGYLNYMIRSEGVSFFGDGVKAGHFSEATVPAGRVAIEVHWPPNHSETKEIDFIAGEEKELVFGGK